MQVQEHEAYITFLLSFKYFYIVELNVNRILPYMKQGLLLKATITITTDTQHPPKGR